MMAEALIKYETIDEGQIQDIMDGREPRPPEDWDEPSSPAPGDDAVKDTKSKDDTRPLGGPASQH